jgi:hypothetical protein
MIGASFCFLFIDVNIICIYNDLPPSNKRDPVCTHTMHGETEEVGE